MKKIKMRFLLTILLSLATNADAYFGYSCDFFDAVNGSSTRYGKHGRAVSNVLKMALSTNSNRWDQPELPIVNDLCIQYTFFPESELNSKKDSKRKFVFSELEYSNHEKYRKLDDLVLEVKDELKVFDDYKYRQEARESQEHIRHTFQYEVTVIDKNINCICFETFLYAVSQRFFDSGSVEDILGNKKEKVLTPIEEKKFESTPTEYTLNFAVDLGSGKFRKYTYRLRNYNPNEEDKTLIVNLFKHVEEQIKKVPS